MTGPEYEEYVTNIVRQFSFCKEAIISNNRKFPGKRQPGEYEIDIAIEIRFSELIYFLMIIECKHWNKPVDRPVIQNLAQTKDAISAHKAVAVASKGFSEEARSVAIAHSIALWWVDPLLDDDRKDFLRGVAFCLREPLPIEKLYYELRSYLFSTLGIDRNKDINGHLHHIDTIVGNAYAQITSFEDWRNLETLHKLVEWENSSIQEILNFTSSVDRPDPIAMQDILQAIVSNNELRFLHLMKSDCRIINHPV